MRAIKIINCCDRQKEEILKNNSEIKTGVILPERRKPRELLNKMEVS